MDNDDLYYTFQYPQADRRGCNWAGGVGGWWTAGVSVSTSGSKGVQPGNRQPETGGGNVSVSTSGSKGVQLNDARAQNLLNLGFSIHKRIEGGATLIFYVKIVVVIMVSVSTSGSKGVQLILFLLTLANLTCFSIHKRIEGGATGLVGWRAGGLTGFQYPQADRRGCNLNHSM